MAMANDLKHRFSVASVVFLVIITVKVIGYFVFKSKYHSVHILLLL
jgi:hypothetical protein